MNVATYATYPEAQRAVDYLSDQRFPVERTAIVGEGLKTVEQVTGRLDWGRAAGLGFGQGLFIGLFIGLLFGLLGLAGGNILFAVAYGMVMGAITGLVWGLVSYAMTGGRRDFTSIGGMRADRYVIVADAEVAEQARALLANLPAR
ncbi:glycine zipper family protein [Deinococcus metallilatus]|uniref:Glycine zipper family protein n=1 Tax=Deinococcus metallilatus TaxID=1211322 RepID=A0AAJ5F5J9_9DEIO|nr:glycine zipper family protein [Deinococcus metallilatus]RXJ09568.1 glycine zipper family protein [Deinococcus metallilatus]TLK29088.1 glycine zipper family protein [Deinococcus metallilatus]